MNRNIAVIGPFDNNINTASGAVVKCQELFLQLQEEFGSDSLRKVDIFNWRKNPLIIIWKIIQSFISNNYVLIVGSNTTISLLLLYKLLKRYSKAKLLYIVVGSLLPTTLSNNPKRLRFCNCIDSFFIETQDCVDELKKLDLNAILFRNFKRIDPINMKELISYSSETPIKFVIFSRINEQKGVTDAINAINAQTENCELDIYGPVEDTYKEVFFELVENSSRIYYKGVVNSNESVKILSSYYCLLFPTKYVTEGIPGTLIDSLAAGVPIISSDFPRSKYVFEHENEGLKYEFGSYEALVLSISYAINNPKKINSMRLNCLKSFGKYSPNEAIKPLVKYITEN